MITFIEDHLWQSTLFAVAVGLLAMALRRNAAGIRYWLWFSASVKFLVPFAPLFWLGSHLQFERAANEIAIPSAGIAAAQVAEPFSVAAPLAPAPHTQTDWTPTALLGLWVCGFSACALMRFRGWLRIRSALRNSIGLELPVQVEVRASAELFEPGVLGWRSPVLLLPSGIAERLTPAQLSTVLAHELCHVRRRDNLTASIHMLVEAVFWFHPLIWWVGARLVEERERACDEAVLSTGGDPVNYAEAILNVCKLYHEAPIACVSGVTGADLRKRVEQIMTNRIPFRLDLARKFAIVGSAVFVLAAPILIGIIEVPTIRAQNAGSSKPHFEVASIRPCGAGDFGPGSKGGGKKAGNTGQSPERLRLNCIALVEPDGLFGLIHRAYDRYADGRLDPWAMLPIAGGPAWARSERYDISAKAEDNASEAVMNGPMLQALLEERFKLKIHHESRPVPVYELTVAKGGPKLTPFREGSCITVDWTKDPPTPLAPGQKPCVKGIGARRGPNLILAQQDTSLDEFSKLLSLVLDRPVLNKTKIAGRFDFHSAFAIDQTTPRYLPGGDMAGLPGEPSDEPIAPSVFTVVQEEFGLRLVPAKGPREFIVIDHVERPTEN
jgi:uncharacterized protein (TIGR03435 family)